MQMAAKEADDTFNCPVGRYSHVAACVESKLYVWGGWRKDTPEEHHGDKKTKLTSTVEILDLAKLQWCVQRTNGDPPLGVSWCAYTVVGKRIIIYGGYCQHDYCYHNTLHELDTSILTWRQLAVSDAPGAPMKKWDCGLVAYGSNSEKLAVFGGYGLLKKSQEYASYVQNSTLPTEANSGTTNEIHCFVSGKWSSPKVSGERPPPIVGFSYFKTSKYEAIMFGGYAMGESTIGRMNDLYNLDFTDTAHVHCTRVTTPESVPWPIVRSHHSSCVLASPHTGNYKKTHFLTVGGEGNGWERQKEKSGKTLDDVWIGECYEGKTSWKQVHIPDDRLVKIKRQRHSATVYKVSDFIAIVVVQGGVEVMVRDKRIAQQMDMLADTSILEFELHQVKGDEVWVLTRALDFSYYKKIISQRNRSLFCRTASVTSPPFCPLDMDVLLYCQKGDKIIRIIDELAPTWRNIGLLLKFTQFDLENIYQQHPHSPKSCCQKMLSDWLAGRNNERDTRPKNWDTLLEVIKADRWGTLASDIKEIIFDD